MFSRVDSFMVASLGGMVGYLSFDSRLECR